jgi:hypothetical protein
VSTVRHHAGDRHASFLADFLGQWRHRVPDLSAYASKMRVPLLRAENALTAEKLDEALSLGRGMAQTLAPAATITTATPGQRYRPPGRMTPKAQRRRMIRQHNRRMRVRARPK